MRRLPALLLVLVVCAFAAACAHPLQVGPVTRELDGLTSSLNGLTYPPYLLGEPEDAPEEAYDARTADLVGASSPVAPTASQRTALLNDARQFGPITARWLLLPFRSTMTTATKRWLDALGWVSSVRRPTGALAIFDTSDKAVIAESTEQAVEVLLATHGPARAREVVGVRGLQWLSSTATAEDLRTAAPAAQALHLLGEQVPVAEPPQAPDGTVFSHLPENQRTALLENTYEYARFSLATSEHPNIDTATWLHVLDSNLSHLTAQTLYELTSVLKAAGVPDQQLSSVIARLQANRLPTGLYRDPSAFVGDAATTIYGLALRELAGEALSDPALAQAAAHAEEQDGTNGAPRSQSRTADRADEKFVLESVHDLATHNLPDAVELAACDRPRTVGVNDVPGWAFLAMVCHLDQRSIAPPTITPWPLNNPHGVVEAAEIVVAFHDAGHTSDLPAWINLAALDNGLTHMGQLGGLGNTATLIGAIGDLGGTVAPSLVAQATQAAKTAAGCPGHPMLYRAIPGDEFSCDLPTTVAVRRFLAPITASHQKAE